MTKILATKGRTDRDIMLLMIDPSEAPMKKKQVPYTEEAIPAVFPIGSIAKALLFGSTAKLIPISRARGIKNKRMCGGSPKVNVNNSSRLPTIV